MKHFISVMNVWSRCARKKRYIRRSDAKDGANRAKKVSRDCNIREYKCNICGGYHIGHTKRSR